MGWAHAEHFDPILPVSPPLRDFLIQSGYSESQVSTIFPAPVDLKCLQIVDQEQARLALGLPLDKRIILSVGRFQERKHYIDLINILPELPNDVILYMKICTSSSDAYRSEEQVEVNKRIKQLGVENRVIIDKQVLKYEEMGNVYSACDLAVYPFTGEPFGMCASEAMAYEKPLILYDSGNFPSIKRKVLPFSINHIERAIVETENPQFSWCK